MKKTMVLVTSAAVVAMLVAGLAGLFGSGQTPAVHASRLAGISGAGISAIQVQNLDASQSATMMGTSASRRWRRERRRTCTCRA